MGIKERLLGTNQTLERQLAGAHRLSFASGFSTFVALNEFMKENYVGGGIAAGVSMLTYGLSKLRTYEINQRP